MMSKGEEKISSVLKLSNITYKREYIFDDLKYKNRPLRFDFLVFIDNKRILIEIDGPQHYNQVKHFQEKTSDYLHYKENDRRKNKYALLNNIPLFRIPYWDLDKINNLQDIFNLKYLVKSIWHNDLIMPPK